MERLDFLVLGATGFTGKLVVNQLVNILKGSDVNISWGISGRSTTKIHELLEGLRDTGIDASKITVVAFDLASEKSVASVTSKAKIILNCIGPYTIMSEPIIKACIETKTHYLDISAERYQTLLLMTNYNKAAEDANVLLIPNCGFSSIILTSGIFYLERQFKDEFHTVECYIELLIPRRIYFPGYALVHYGTWHSLVYELKNFRQSQQLKQSFINNSVMLQPREIEKSFFHRKNGNTWFPYPGPDKDLIDLSQQYLYEKKEKKPMNTKAYITMPAWFHYIIVPIFLLFYYACCMNWFAKLLCRYPRFFTLGYMSHKGPTEEVAEKTSFVFNITGRQWTRSTSDERLTSNKALIVQVTAPNPYKLTAVCLVTSALTLLKESSKMPSGGVVLPAAAFRDTDLIEILKKYDVTFKVLSEPV